MLVFAGFTCWSQEMLRVCGSGLTTRLLPEATFAAIASTVRVDALITIGSASAQQP